MCKTSIHIHKNTNYHQQGLLWQDFILVMVCFYMYISQIISAFLMSSCANTFSSFCPFTASFIHLIQLVNSLPCEQRSCLLTTGLPQCTGVGVIPSTLNQCCLIFHKTFMVNQATPAVVNWVSSCNSRDFCLSVLLLLCPPTPVT